MLNEEIVFIVEEDEDANDGGYCAYAVGHSIFTQGDTLEEVREMVRDAVQCHFDEGERPQTIRLRFVRHEVIAA